MIDFSQFPYPEAWKTAGDVYTQMAETGMPTDMSDWWKSQQTKAGYDITRAGKEAAEQFGLGGMRYSTPLGQQIGRIGAETTAGIMPEYWRLGAGMQEAARGRQLAGAGGLMGLGGEMGRFPMETGERMLGMGSQLQQMQQRAFQPAYSEWQRNLPEQNPYLQMGQQFPYGQFGQQPQMYDQSFMSQLMGAGAQIAPWLLAPATGGASLAMPALGAAGNTAGLESQTWNPWGG